MRWCPRRVRGGGLAGMRSGGPMSRRVPGRWRGRARVRRQRCLHRHQRLCLRPGLRRVVGVLGVGCLRLRRWCLRLSLRLCLRWCRWRGLERHRARRRCWGCPRQRWGMVVRRRRQRQHLRQARHRHLLLHLRFRHRRRAQPCLWRSRCVMRGRTGRLSLCRRRGRRLLGRLPRRQRGRLCPVRRALRTFG